MNRSICHTFLAATTACGLWLTPATAQTTATTDPVGAVSISVPRQTDIAFNVPLRSTESYSGVVASGGVGNFSLVAADSPSWQTNKFTEEPHFLIFSDGSADGYYFTVASNTANTIEIEDTGVGTLKDLSVSAGDKFKVYKYWTLGGLSQTTSGIVSSTDPFNPVFFVYFPDIGGSGIRRPLAQAYFYYDGTDNLGPAGWYQLGNLAGGLMDDVVLAPDNFYIFRNLSSQSATVAFTGGVGEGSLGVILVGRSVRNDNYVAGNFPVETSLIDSGLATSPAYKVSPDPFNPEDLVYVYDNQDSGIRKPLGRSFFYYDGTGGLGAAGWYELGNLGGGLMNDEMVFGPDKGVVVRKSQDGGSGVWISN